MQRLRILYLSSEDPTDKKSWSGIHYNILTQLQKYYDVTITGPLSTSRITRIRSRLLYYYSKYILHKRYDALHSGIIGKDHARQIQQKISRNHQLIFSTASSRELACLETAIPIIHLSDATFELVYNYYEGFSNLSSFSFKQAEESELKAIGMSALRIYSSDWASASAISHYHADPSTTFVVPFGANIDSIPEINLESKQLKKIFNLLFLGVNWKRKGGDIVYATFLELKRRGIECHLTICGCTPPFEIKDPAVTIIPFLNKNNKEDLQVFAKLLNESHLLFLPTRADCTPIVFCEAAAYGLPVITTDTGGVSSIVINEETGYCLPFDAGANEYASVIEALANDREKYTSMAWNSRERFLQYLNWDSWGRQIKKIIDKHILKRSEDAPYSIARSR
jgi:glycosyltransferase involved in cell wall biosynthesis